MSSIRMSLDVLVQKSPISLDFSVSGKTGVLDRKYFNIGSCAYKNVGSLKQQTRLVL